MNVQKQQFKCENHKHSSETNSEQQIKHFTLNNAADSTSRLAGN